MRLTELIWNWALSCNVFSASAFSQAGSVWGAKPGIGWMEREVDEIADCGRRPGTGYIFN